MAEHSGAITLGDGLQIDGQTLKALGGGGSEWKYLHHIAIRRVDYSKTTNQQWSVDIYCLRKTANAVNYTTKLSDSTTTRILSVSGIITTGVTASSIVVNYITWVGYHNIYSQLQLLGCAVETKLGTGSISQYGVGIEVTTSTGFTDTVTEL